MKRYDCIKLSCPKCNNNRLYPAFIASDDSKLPICPDCGLRMERKSRRKPKHEEHHEQVAFVAWAKDWLPELLRVYLFAIPSGMRTFHNVSNMTKLEGMKAGVPDICFAWPRQKYHGLYIEMKRKDGGKIGPDQRIMIDALRRADYAVAVCPGSESAQRVFRWYMYGGDIPQELAA